jgi:hypothetical protein
VPTLMRQSVLNYGVCTVTILQVFAVSMRENSGRVLNGGEPLSVAPGMVFYVKVELQYVHPAAQLHGIHARCACGNCVCVRVCARVCV